MKNRLLYGFIFISLVLLFMVSSASGVTYYDNNGIKVDKNGYEKQINLRKEKITEILNLGYGINDSGLEDPVRLRKKRMEQWRLYRKFMTDSFKNKG